MEVFLVWMLTWVVPVPGGLDISVVHQSATQMECVQTAKTLIESGMIPHEGGLYCVLTKVTGL